jgi:hypothetical protein
MENWDKKADMRVQEIVLLNWNISKFDGEGDIQEGNTGASLAHH